MPWLFFWRRPVPSRIENSHNLPRFRHSHNSVQGRLLKALEEGCGLVRLRFSAPKVPFPAWLEQHDRFSAELGLAEKALVKFSMDKEKWSYTMPGSVSPLQCEPRSTFVCNMDTD